LSVFQKETGRQFLWRVVLAKGALIKYAFGSLRVGGGEAGPTGEYSYLLLSSRWHLRYGLHP